MANKREKVNSHQTEEINFKTCASMRRPDKKFVIGEKIDTLTS